jgi:hypothetical protein
LSGSGIGIGAGMTGAAASAPFAALTDWIACEEQNRKDKSSLAVTLPAEEQECFEDDAVIFV